MTADAKDVKKKVPVKKDSIMKALLASGPISLSSMRFTLLISVLISNLVIFTAWCWLSIRTNSMYNIPDSVLYLYTLSNGLPLTGKVVQKHIERLSERGCYEQS